ncbi:hypothetical protein D3C71_1382400 [compost metagenome]
MAGYVSGGCPNHRRSREGGHSRVGRHQGFERTSWRRRSSAGIAAVLYAGQHYQNGACIDPDAASGQGRINAGPEGDG